MKRTLVLLLCLGVSLLVSGVALAKPIVFSGRTETAPAFIYIENVGKFSVINGKTFPVEEELAKRSNLLGLKVELPSEIRIFVPATEKTVAQLIEGISAKQIANGLIINPMYPQDKGLLRVFLGPRLIDQNGEDIIGASMYFEGSTKISMTRGGRINPSVEMRQGQKKIRMIIYKEGYGIEVVDVVLSKEALGDLELKIPVSKEDIELKTALNRTFDVRILNSLSKIYVGAHFETRYEKIGSQMFVFHVIVTDDRQNKSFVASIDLTPNTLKVGNVLEIKQIDKLPSGEGFVDMSEVPTNIPRIIVAQESIEFTEFEVEQEAVKEVSKELTDSELDPTYKVIFLIVILLLLGFVVTLIIFGATKKAKARARMEKHKARLAFEQRCSLCEIPESLWGAVELAEEFAKEPKLNRVSRDAYGPALSNIKRLLDEVWRKNQYVGELSKAINAFKSFVAKQITEMESALDDSDYGMAALFQGRIEEAEERIDAIEGSRSDLVKYLSNQRAVAKELFIALAKMNDKAERLISQVDSEGNLAKMGQEIQSILDGLVASFSEESVNLDPESIQRTQAERQTAQNAGVSANDVDKMREFLKKRRDL